MTRMEFCSMIPPSPTAALRQASVAERPIALPPVTAGGSDGAQDQLKSHHRTSNRSHSRLSTRSHSKRAFGRLHVRPLRNDLAARRGAINTEPRPRFHQLAATRQHIASQVSRLGLVSNDMG